MIGLVPQDGKRAVELLDKDEAHQFVRECHFAQGDFLVGAVIDFGREAIGSAHDKHQPLAAARHAALEPLAVIDRGALGAVLVEQDHVVAGLECGEQCAAFGSLLLRLTHVAGVAHIPDVLDVEGYIVP